MKRSVEKQKDVFIDYIKAFDIVKHRPLVELLKSLDQKDADTRLLTHLYWNQTAAVICDKQSVRQGCVASPHLFALYTEMIMRNVDDMDGLVVM